MKRALTVAGAILLALIAAGGYQFFRVYYGFHVYETTPPTLPADLHKPAILIFSKTNGFRQDDAVKASDAALAGIAARRGWSAFVTKNGAVFNAEQLSQFHVTVWNNTSGDTLNAEQKAAFQKYIENGGGFVGIHGAGGDPHYEWRWYVEKLLGAQFKGHPLNPKFQQATIHVNAGDPITRGIPENWTRTDEWYSFEKAPQAADGFTILGRLDEKTYSPKMFGRDIGMGADHPVIWKHQVGDGRVFYSALGHSASTYAEAAHLKLLENAIEWAGKMER